MAHKTLIGGTAYEIDGGKTLVGGTAYEINGGKTLVDGTAYEIFFAPEGGGSVVLEVEKITSATYANDTTYENEEFILLDIYPKTGGTVSVTYGGLTKTITDTSGAEEPNAQQVFFGTFNGVSDSVATPSSGELTIEGDCRGFGVSKFVASSKSYGTHSYCGCITDVSDFGRITYLPDYMFASCSSLTDILLPPGASSISSYMFWNCTGLTDISFPSDINIGSGAFCLCTNITHVSLPSDITSIESSVFSGCTSLSLISLPDSLVSIGASAFYDCTSLSLTSLPDSLVSIGDSAFYDCTSLSLTSLPDSLENVGSDAFAECGFRLTSFPSGLVSIGNSSFGYTCNNIISFNFRRLETIDDYAIRQSNSATSIIFGENITYIGSYQFSKITSNDASKYPPYEVVFLATVPPELGTLALGYAQGTTSAAGISGVLTKVTVPKSCSEAYKAAKGWSYYVDVIVEAS